MFYNICSIASLYKSDVFCLYAMIKSKEDLFYYLECDKKALQISHKRPRLFTDEIWRYEIALRKMEYYTNCISWGGAYITTILAS